MAALASHDPAGGMAGVGGQLYMQAPQRPGPRGLLPDEQFLPSQHFYPPAIQPFFPYQWPMSSFCVPYSGFHGLGYGMMPLLLPPCLEGPGGMIPQPQLHMMDYRRMNPHVLPTTAHQTHRSHSQNSVPLGRVMVSSEVQTETICQSIDSRGHVERSDTCSESGRGTGCDSTVSTPPRCSDNKSIACPEGVSMMAQNYNGANAVDDTFSVVPKSEILKAEQMQIQFREMPSESNIIQNKENIELASYNESDLLQCSLGSVQSSEDVVLCSYKSLAFKKDKQTVEAGMLRYSRKCSLSSCTEVNLVKMSPSCRSVKSYVKPSRPQSINTKKTSEMLPKAKVKEDENSLSNFKILHLPFGLQNHNQPCQLEASIWSVESLFPYVPSDEWMAKNGLLTPQKPLSPVIEPSDVISKLNRVHVEKNLQTQVSTTSQCLPHHLDASVWSVESLMPYVPSNEGIVENVFVTPRKPLRPRNKSCDVLSELNLSASECSSVGNSLHTGELTKSHGLPCQLEASVWSVESLMPYVPSSKWMAENGLLTSQKPESSQIKFPNILSKPNQSSTNSVPVGKNLQTGASTKCKDSFGSLETCSPYRPSSSWLADFGNVYYYSKIPVGQEQSDNLESRKQKLSLANSPESSPLRNGRKTRNQRPAICVTDRKQYLSHTCRCNAESSPRLAGSAIMRGWVSELKGKDQKRHLISGGLCCKIEQIAEVKNIYKQRSEEGIPDLGNHLSECKLRGQTGLCEFCPCIRASPAQGNVIRCGDLGCWEKSGEGQNIINRNKKLQKDNACKGSVWVSNTERKILKNERKTYLQELALEGNA